MVFFQVLDIASITLFLMTMDCQYFDVPEDHKYMNQQFPTVCEYDELATDAHNSCLSCCQS